MAEADAIFEKLRPEFQTYLDDHHGGGADKLLAALGREWEEKHGYKAPSAAVKHWKVLLEAMHVPAGRGEVQTASEL